MNYDAFTDELEKIAKERDWMWPAAGIAGGAALGGLAFLAAKKGLRTDVMNRIRSLGRGGARAAEQSKSLPKGAVRDARRIAEQLRGKGIDPSKARIAISGTGGTGKSTMAKALAQELGMATKETERIVNATSGRNWSKLVGNKKALPKGFIYEQTQLMNSVSPDRFDAIIKLEQPMKTVEKRILGRGRGASQLDVYNYPKLQKSINTAFNTTKGPTLRPGSGIEMKIKPAGGFQADSMLADKVRSMGLNPSKLTREEQVISVAQQGKTWLGGNKSLLNKSTFGGGAGALLGGGAAGGYGAKKYQDSRD